MAAAGHFAMEAAACFPNLYSSLPACPPARPAPQAWRAEGSALVVSERLINCPPQLAPPLQRGLFEEIAAAAEEGETQVRAQQVHKQEGLSTQQRSEWIEVGGKAAEGRHSSQRCAVSAACMGRRCGGPWPLSGCRAVPGGCATAWGISSGTSWEACT